MKNKLLSTSNILSAFLILFSVSLIVSPDVKAFIFKGLYRMGYNKFDASADKLSFEKALSGNQERPVAPSLIFEDGDGRFFDISKQKGKVLFLNFWATWCPNCLAEMPSINKLRQSINNPDLLFVMVDRDNNYRKSSSFMARNNYNLPVYTSISSLPKDLIPSTIPTTIIIDKEGNIVARHVGGADYSVTEAQNFFRDLLKK